jgi:hypothetical protein
MSRPKPQRIFSGDYSKSMWERINSAETVDGLREALYLVCCRLQELEAQLDERETAVRDELMSRTDPRLFG